MTVQITLTHNCSTYNLRHVCQVVSRGPESTGSACVQQSMMHASAVNDASAAVNDASCISAAVNDDELYLFVWSL